MIPIILVAQVPNASFEMWSDGNPDNWLTSNIPGAATPVTQSGTSNSGSFAVRGEVVPFVQTVLAPYLYAGTGELGFAVSERHEGLTGYYQFSPQENDILFVAVLMFDQDVTLIGTGGAFLEEAGVYTQFNVPIEYFFSGTPTQCVIEFVVNDTIADVPDIGTFFLLDDLALSGPTSISGDEQAIVPNEFSLEQNFPNPFNPSTTIEYTLTQSGEVKLDVYNSLGQHISTLFDGIQTAGRHVVQWQPFNLSSGVYLYRLETKNQVLTRKMLLTK
jgi:hypothetical protein